MTTDERRRRTSRAVHRVGEAAAGEWVASSVGTLVVAWLVVYAIKGFPSWMATALEVVAASTTLVMVFVIHHTQRRREVAVHLKLDELVRSSDADDAIAEIETNHHELDRQHQDRQEVAR